MDQPPPTHRAFRRIASVSVTLLLAEILLASSGVLGLVGSLALNKLWELGCALAAVIAWGSSALRHRGRHRRWRWWMTAAMGVFLLGLITWIWGQVVKSTSIPTETLGPAGYLLTPILALLAVVLRTYDPGRHRGSPLDTSGNRMLPALDLLIIASSILLFVFVTYGGQLATSWATSGPILTLLIAHPLAYLLLVAGIVILARIRPTARDLPLLLIALAAMSYVASSTLFARVVELKLPFVPPWVEAGFMAAPLLFFLAALAPSGTNDAVEDPPRGTVRELVHLAVPYFPLLATIGFIAAGMAAGVHLDQRQQITFLILMTLVILRQITTLAENNRLLRRAEHEALHEPLTGLANRTLFVDQLERAMKQRTTGLALVFCDMDDFKEVNDTFGHVAGDFVLAETARRLQGCARPGDVVARLGGDEFALLLRNGTESLPEIEHRLLSTLQQPYLINGEPRMVSASVGLTSIPRDMSVSSTDELLHWADTAMYTAKRRGKNTLAYAPETEEHACEYG